jgi:hypothetical protein
MPTIPAFSLVGTTVDPAEIYSNMLYGPGGTTLERLNGGLEDTTNYAGGDDSIESYSVQNGSFAVGVWHGTDRWSHTYEGQIGGENNDASRVQHDYLAAKLVLPWTARMVLFGYQGWFVHEAYRHDLLDDSPPAEEYWSIRLLTQGVKHAALHARLPSTMSTRHPAGSCKDVPTDDTDGSPAGTGAEFKEHDPDRFRYHAKMGIDENVARGEYDIAIHVWALLHERAGGLLQEDFPNWETHMEMRSGAVWALAIR